MHLIIVIVIGIFCGLWMFTHWAEWHTNPSSRIGGFLRGRSIVFQQVGRKGLHYIRVQG
jgi:hypothetical protein